MNFENTRTREMQASMESQVGKLEGQIKRTRDKLEDEKRILTKHELTLNRKTERGREPGITETRLQKKQARIALLQDNLEEIEAMAEVMRDEITRLLDFSPVQESLADLPPKFRRAEAGEWQIPNCRFKTFQDIFTPAEARILPNYRRKPSYNEYQRLGVQACPVDPHRIPDWFMEEFGLGQMKGVSGFEKLEQKASSIPEIRDIFSKAEPLGIYGRRTYRVIVTSGLGEEYDGKLITAAYQGQEDREKDRKTMQCFGSAYEAHRATLHTQSGYVREQEKIHGVNERVGGILKEVHGMRQSDPRLDEINDRIESELEILGRVLNVHKAQAADILEEVKGLKDSLGRHNPGAACRRIVAALDRFEKRLPEIFWKSKSVNEDQRILGHVIDECRGRFDSARKQSLGICEALEGGHPAPELQARLAAMEDLGDMQVRPFKSYAGKMEAKKQRIRDALASGDQDVLREASLNAYVAMKAFQIHHERDMILRDIAASPIETSIESLLDRARHLQGVAVSKETFPSVRTGENEPYREMVSKVNGLVRGLEAYRRRNLSESERLAMYERMKAYLAEIDFTEILEKL